jgi:hypothetical protein
MAGSSERTEEERREAAMTDRIHFEARLGDEDMKAKIKRLREIGRAWAQAAQVQVGSPGAVTCEEYQREKKEFDRLLDELLSALMTKVSNHVLEENS